MTLRRRVSSRLVSSVCVLALLVGCAGHKPRPERLIIGSADNVFSSLLARLYAGALRSSGFIVDTNFELSTRQKYLDAIDQNQASIVPDLMGSLLAYLDPASKAMKPEEVFSKLNSALPEGLSVGDYTPAGDTQVIAMSRELAQQWKVNAISDLQEHCAALKAVWLAAEVATQRAISAINIGQGCVMSEPKSVVTPAEVSSAATGNEAYIFWATELTVQPGDSDLVVLRDDGQYFRAENIVPIFRKGALTDLAQTAVNKVAGELSTGDLANMIRQITSEGLNPEVVAQRWLAQHLF
ncbi:MAG: glycine betaine ABC transporter substrate-binding protein [Mycobacteriaceae bacterium]